jgi:ankyrin repeat protein
MHAAAAGGHKDIVELLLTKGADINIKDRQGQTPLQIAQEKGHTEIADLLKKRGSTK